MAVQIRLAHEDRSSAARQMSRWVDQVLSKGFRCTPQAWAPAINLYEDDESYCVVAELSGVEADKIDLRVEKDSLVVSGDRPTPRVPQGHAKRLLMMEIDHGPFCRVIKMPPDADLHSSKGVTATYRGGYLWVHINKRKANSK